MLKRIWVQVDENDVIVRAIREFQWYDFDSDKKVEYILTQKNCDESKITDFEEVQRLIDTYNMRDITKKEEE